MNQAQTILAAHPDATAAWSAAEAEALAVYLTVNRDGSVAALPDGSAIGRNGDAREVALVAPGIYADESGYEFRIY